MSQFPDAMINSPLPVNPGKRLRRKFHGAAFPPRLARFLQGNTVTLLQNGEAYFKALERAFDRAQCELFLQSYIYENDATGRRIAEALKRAARRGVNVYLLIDGYGSKALPQSLLDDLRESGVKVLIFRPKISPWSFRRKRLRRMHKKVAVVDREIAFVGGINIIDDCLPKADLPPRFDYAVAVQGPLVEEIHISARRQWSMASWYRFRKRTAYSGVPPESNFSGGQMSAAFLVRDNFRHRRSIERAYLQAIEQAQSEIILANAYFLPGLTFRHAMMDAALRGVRVVLLLQGREEFFFQHYATRALFGELIDAGIEIYEYRKSFLHAKVAVIDGHWATVGSSNLDPFSLLLSREANVVVDHPAFAATLAQSLKQTTASDAVRIQSDRWKRRPLGLRFLSWISYGLLRLIMVISGYSRERRPRSR
jgi:cardiolipin synthase